MKIISESKELELGEQLPQIIQRIFAVCKADPAFPLKDKMHKIEGEISVIRAKLIKQEALLRKSRQARNDLSERMKHLVNKNSVLKEQLLEELGSGGS